MGSYRVDLTGQTFGRLTAIEPTGHRIGKHIEWRCRCLCGGEKLTHSGALKSGHTGSCGCLDFEHKHTIGGQNRSPTHYSWRAMHARCRNPKAIGYEHWGGRGIKVCDRWRDFNNFLADMGPRPAGMTIERKNNDKDYEPGNCEWASRKVQATNRSTTVLVTFNGETRPLQDWAARTGIKAPTLWHRLRHGWPVDRALLEPTSGHRL